MTLILDYSLIKYILIIKLMRFAGFRKYQYSWYVNAANIRRRDILRNAALDSWKY